MGSTTAQRRPKIADYSSLLLTFQTEVDKYTSEYDVFLNRSQSITSLHAKLAAQVSTGIIPPSCRQKLAALKSGPLSQASLDVDLAAKALEINQWLANRWITALAEEKAAVAKSLGTLRDRASMAFQDIVQTEMEEAGFEEAYYLLQGLPFPARLEQLYSGQIPFTRDQITEVARSHYDVCKASLKAARDTLSTNLLFIKQKAQFAIEEAAKKAAERQTADTCMGEASVALSEPAVRLVIARETDKIEARLTDKIEARLTAKMEARLSYMASVYSGPFGFPSDVTTGKQTPDIRHQQQPQQGKPSRGGGGRRGGQGRNPRVQHFVPQEISDPAMAFDQVRGRGRGMGRGRGPPRGDRGRGSGAGKGAS